MKKSLQSPKRQSQSVSNTSLLVVMASESSRPDLRSPLGSMRSVSPGTLLTDSGRRESLKYSDDFETYKDQTYSEDFEPPTASGDLVRYSEDFDETRSKPVPSPRYVRRKPEHGGKLETVSITAIGEDIETLLSDDTILRDSYPATLSGRTSRLTWQYSEDFTEAEPSVIAPYDDTRSSQEDTSLTDYEETRSKLTSEATTSDECSQKTREISTNAEQGFVEFFMKRLQQAKSSMSSHTEAFLPDETVKKSKKSENYGKRGNKEEINALKDFCKNVVNKLQEPQSMVQQNKPIADTLQVQSDTLQDSVKFQLSGLQSNDYAESYGISRIQVNKLKLENTKAKMKKMAEESFHEPHNCADCLVTKADFAQREFLREKLRVATEINIREKVENAITQNFVEELIKDPSLMPGKLHEDFGHLDSQIIWNKLAEAKSKTAMQSSCDIEKQESVFPLCPQLASDAAMHTEVETCRKITDHVEFINLQAEQVKQELRDEHKHLSGLDAKDFWHHYFSKLKYFEGFPSEKSAKFGT